MAWLFSSLSSSFLFSLWRPWLNLCTLCVSGDFSLKPGNSPYPLPGEHTLRQGLKTDSSVCFHNKNYFILRTIRSCQNCHGWIFLVLFIHSLKPNRCMVSGFREPVHMADGGRFELFPSIDRYLVCLISFGRLWVIAKLWRAHTWLLLLTGASCDLPLIFVYFGNQGFSPVVWT